MSLDLPGPALRPELLAAGYTDEELRRARRTGELVAVRRGAYVPATDERLADTAARHALAVRAAIAQLPAAAAARTVVDTARRAPFTGSVVIADAALQAGLVDPAALADAVGRARRRPGVARARRVVAFADGGGQSVGESRSRVLLARAGLPPPVLQWPVVDGFGRHIGTTDFGWPDVRTVGEFDGAVKYGRLLRPGQSPGDAVVAEKWREDRLRDEGLRVVRWIWRELDDVATIVARLQRAFAAAR